MRYNDRVTFAIESKGSYNPKTSRYDNSMLKLNPMPCNHSPLSPGKTALEFGDVKKSINVVRLNGHFKEQVTHAFIKGIKHQIVKRIDYEHDTVFYIEEVI
ncbi:hypothetical protein L4I60_03225 [Staphylococcus epidermidis]|uniref:hypothetical protein n=1 Tax=Staphylococcus epidermidis TaxID=1282 RepID=UPI000C183E60|nr:hypothetical protein [Staphylococcus epidermidis]MCF7581271.1 hypothetical protein [Staphylococcus epidermidis]